MGIVVPFELSTQMRIGILKTTSLNVIMTWEVSFLSELYLLVTLLSPKVPNTGCFQRILGEIVRKIENILASSPKSESWREFQRLRVRRSRRT